MGQIPSFETLYDEAKKFLDALPDFNNPLVKSAENYFERNIHFVD